MKKLKIGYYLKYIDPKDLKEKTGLIINFDDEMIIIWHSDFLCPYPIPKIQVVDEPESKLEFEFISESEPE